MPQLSGWLTSRTTGANRAASAASSVEAAAAVEADANGTTIRAASAARWIHIGTGRLSHGARIPRPARGGAQPPP